MMRITDREKIAGRKRSGVAVAGESSAGPRLQRGEGGTADETRAGEEGRHKAVQPKLCAVLYDGDAGVVLRSQASRPKIKY